MLAIVLQDKKTSEEFYKLYYEMLEDIPDNAMVKVAKDCLYTCRFFPTIAEIRQKAEKFNIEKSEQLMLERDSSCEGVIKDGICNIRNRCSHLFTTKCKEGEVLDAIVK